MRRIILPIVLSSARLFAGAVAVRWLHPRPVRAQQGCTLSTLQGSYGIRIDGWNPSSDPAKAPQPFAQVGTGVFDGAGNLSVSVTTSGNGQISKQALTYKYQVNADCSGSVTPAPGSEGGPGDIVAVNGGSQALFIGTSPGLTLSGVAIRQ
jgi:hypothetical protein